uniref:Transposase n=1 Tax=Clostridium botulinum TaxID=1491 RepID=R4NFT2_CLOBO|nr:transposase [Clostridium botulinum]AGL45049.1 transposase [Clostridium botulinum]AGL45089.1 transposase [Clostridium botulinum]AGL45129.1 transposase [Clostridium botulinum]AGL45169.1 transposase [Clostridium botulinum]
MILNYTYYKLRFSRSEHFNRGYKFAKKYFKKSKVVYIYEAATNVTSLDKIFKTLKIA